jgi:hypothetical protein
MKKIFTLSALALPGIAFAQGTGDLTSFVEVMGNIVNLLVPLTSTLAVVFFFYGLAKYILNSGDEEKRKEGKSIMIWGILAMFVLVTIWGIIGFMQNTIGNEAGPTNVDVDLPDVASTQFTGGPFGGE